MIDKMVNCTASTITGALPKLLWGLYGLCESAWPEGCGRFAGIWLWIEAFGIVGLSSIPQICFYHQPEI